MVTKLQKYFPMLHTKEEILTEILSKDHLKKMFNSWDEEYQQIFLDFCTGAKGVKMLYDFMSKSILNPETHPERISELLSLLLEQKISIIEILPNDNTRLADESSLVIMDIVVQLEDGSIVNLEIQKMGYYFPGERCACYSADLLLRQYQRIRKKTKKKSCYKDIHDVYTIILFENSPQVFKSFSDTYIHHFEQHSDTGAKLNLLQKYLFVSLDIFKKIHHNTNSSMNIENRLDAWLAFLSTDEPEVIISIIEKYPDFKVLYEQIYDICRNIEEVMNMFSKELLELDRNTVEYMMDEMQKQIDQKDATIQQQTLDMQAIKMFYAGASTVEITAKTGHTAEQLKKLIES